MKTLIEITRLVNAFKESHQRAEEKITNSNRFKEIYEGILMGKYQTDEEVITDLYNTPSGKKEKLNLDALGKYGEIKYLTLEEIFGY